RGPWPWLWTSSTPGGLTHRRQRWAPRDPPSPMPLPGLGSLLQVDFQDTVCSFSWESAKASARSLGLAVWQAPGFTNTLKLRSSAATLFRGGVQPAAGLDARGRAELFDGRAGGAGVPQ
ncbi:hypothetical protein HPG69_018733, partial [Diceros bicornis minor]